MKKWWWSPFVRMVGAVLQSVWLLYRINKDKDNELPRNIQRIILEP